ncbi:MAG: carboxymethylenebutenolidase [Frankiaceae bacterium]|nr:carboxymethylenebutenolidase [Frankiaceae bacterium]
MYDAMLAETVQFPGHNDDLLEGYCARPLDSTPRGGVVVIHHLPGYDRETKEYVRRFAVMGFNAVCPNLYTRLAPGASPDDAAALARAQGGVPDEQVVGDVAGAMRWLKALSTSNGKVATIGHCSGGRHSFLASTHLDLDAAIVCYGGLIVGETPAQLPSMVPLVDRSPLVRCPILGLFGNDDQFPTPAQVDELEKTLQSNGKDIEFHRYDGAGHAFFGPDRPAYRVEAALDGWERIQTFLDTRLAG